MPQRRCLQNRNQVRMPSTEQHRMDPRLQWQLKAALDRITPPTSFPRYASAVGRLRPWRVAPFLLAAATSILLALTATATTGSPNPAVWSGDAASAIGSVAHTAEPSPIPSPIVAPPPAAPRKAAAPAPTQAPEQRASPRPEPSVHPEESPRSQPSASPSPSGDHSGSSAPTTSPSPSPTPDDR
jgi:hypothetical protein